MKKIIVFLLALLFCANTAYSANMGNLRVSHVPHVFGGYENKALTLTCEADAWTHITNGTSDLWDCLKEQQEMCTNFRLTQLTVQTQY